jgi:SAM-dependent methyltransferase
VTVLTTLAAMPEPPRSRASVRGAVVWQVLRETLADLPAAGRTLTVLDVGGGSGGFAVPVAELGHTVTVVDPSPDSLAALARRAAEAGVTDRVAGRQGDVTGLFDVVAPHSCDAVLCHSVLEVVDDPAAAMQLVATAVRPGGVVSVLVASRTAAVLGRALTGRFTDARALLSDPSGRSGPQDPLVRRFTADELCDLLVAAGLRVGAVHGVRVFSDLLPGALLESDPSVVAELLALEAAAAALPVYRDLATQLHVVAHVD